MIHRIFIIVLVLLSGCGISSDKNEIREGDFFRYGVNVWHDDERNVTCWVFVEYQKGGISCIPDWQLKEPK